MIYPKISIVIPTLNRVKYLEEAILSIITQNYPNLELIIIDGGSIDNSIEIIKKYKTDISYYVSEKDEGMYHAINKGFSKSTGEILSWLNSDDLYHQQSLFTIAKVFSENQDIEWISGMPSFFNENGECVKITKPILRTWNHFLIGDYKWIQQENTFWRRTLWEKSGSKLNTDYKLAADCELWFRFFQYSKLFYVETSFAGFRMHGKQLSLINIEHYELEALQIYNYYTKKIKPSFKVWLAKTLFNGLKLRSENNSWLNSLASSILKFILKTNNQLHYNFSTNKWVR